MLQRVAATIWGVLCLAGCSVTVVAPDALLPETPENGAFFALSAADADGLADWYEAQLGFERRASHANAEREAILLRRPGVLLEIAGFNEARARDSLSPALESYLVHGIFKIGFIVADLDASFANAESAAMDIFFPVVKADDDWRSFAIRDPEGNIVQFFGR